MPRYTLRVGNRKVPIAKTETSISESIGRRLQNAKPQTKVDSGGSQNRVSFAGQDISRSDLKDIKEIRESGGIITSVEFHAEDPDLEDWLRSNLPNIDLTVLEMGEDAT